MINKLIIAICSLGLIAPAKLYSQHFKLLAKPQGDRILLKAAPTSLQSWEGWKYHGMELERRESGSGNGFEPLLDTRLTPPEASELRSSNADTEIADAIIHLLEESRSISAPTSIKQMVEADKKMRYTHGFYLLLSSMDPEASRLSGFQLETQFLPGKYDYRIAIPELAIDTVITVNHTTLATRASGPQLNAAESHGAVILHWDHQPFFRTVLAYDVERRVNNGEWKKLNRSSIVHTRNNVEETAFTYLMQHVDSVENYVPHEYRLISRDYFGERIEPSGIISAQAVDRKAPGTVHSTEAKLEDDASAALSWLFKGDSLDLDAFFVLRSEDGVTGEYTKIHDNPLPADARSYRDTTIDLSKSYYYRIMNADTARNFSLSDPEYLLIPDTIPPPSPQKLGARIDSSGTVLLTWKQSEANDIKGYKIFRGDRVDFDYVQVSKGAIASNGFLDSLNLKSMDPHVFYYVIAMDQNYNHSGPSDTLKVNRPDILPPSAPVLHTMRQEDDMITLEWHPTPAPDLDKYLIESETEQGWQPVDSVSREASSAELNPGNFREITSFRVIAVDVHGLRSEAVNTKRYIPLKQGASGPDAPTLIFDEEDQRVRLTWGQQDQPHQVLIYRGTDNDSVRLYRSTQGTADAFEDLSVDSGTTYRYQIAYQNEKGVISQRSDENSISIP